MKKTLLSVVLCVAVILGTMSAMFAMPASAAADPIELLVEANTSVGGAGPTFEFVDGDLVITSTGTEGSIAIVGPGTYDAATYQYTCVELTSDVPFTLAFYDEANGESGKWITSNGDFSGANDFGPADANGWTAAGTYTLNLFTKNAYTWDGSALPDDVRMTSIYIEPKGNGTLTVKELYLNDGNLKPAEVDLTSKSHTAESAWANVVELADTDASKWVASAPVGDANSEVVVGTNENGKLTFGNTAGLYPSASIAVDKTVAYENDAIYFDFSVISGGQTTVYLFFGAATPDDFEGEGKAYAAIVADVGVGNYTGYVHLKDMELVGDKAVVDADGNIKISYLKVFGSTVGAAADVCNPAVVMNTASLYYGEVEEGGPTAAAPTTTKPTETAPTNAGATTTVKKPGAGTTIPKTADTTESVLFVAVAAAAVAVVTLSAVASKKAQSR